MAYTFQNTDADVPFQVSIHLVLPVDWDECRFVNCNRFGGGVHMELEWFTFHQGQRLVFANIECCWAIVVQ